MNENELVTRTKEIPGIKNSPTFDLNYFEVGKAVSFYYQDRQYNARDGIIQSNSSFELSISFYDKDCQEFRSVTASVGDVIDHTIVIHLYK